MNATDVIEEMKTFPTEERQKVLHWLQKEGLQDLWRHVDGIMKDKPKFTEEEILNLPRVRPAGY